VRGIPKLATKIVGQQKQRPEEGIPEEAPIPKHRDATIIPLPEGRVLRPPLPSLPLSWVDPVLEREGYSIGYRRQPKNRRPKITSPKENTGGKRKTSASRHNKENGGAETAVAGGGGRVW